MANLTQIKLVNISLNYLDLSEILTSSNFMMFTSNYENVTNQWLCVIQYLTSK